MRNGLLQCRDVGSWWLGIPGAGVFMRHFTKGRQKILRMIRKRKFKEILQRVKFDMLLMQDVSLQENSDIFMNRICMSTSQNPQIKRNELYKYSRTAVLLSVKKKDVLDCAPYWMAQICSAVYFTTVFRQKYVIR